MSTKPIPETLRNKMSKAGKASWEARRQRAADEEAAQAATQPAPQPEPIVIDEILCPLCAAPALVLPTGPEGAARIGDQAQCSKACGAKGHVVETENGEAGVKWDNI